MGKVVYMSRDENVQRSFRSSRIFHAIPSLSFSALRNSACLSYPTPRCFSANRSSARWIRPCSHSPRVRFHRIPSKDNSERLNPPMSLNPSLNIFIQYPHNMEENQEKKHIFQSIHISFISNNLQLIRKKQKLAHFLHYYF